MHNSEFEKKVQQKMEEFRLTPGDAVWKNVEASLPEEKKRRWLIWFFLIAGLLTAGILLVNNNKIDQVKIANNNANKINNDTSKNTIQEKQSLVEEKTKSDTALSAIKNKMNAGENISQRKRSAKLSAKTKISLRSASGDDENIDLVNNENPVLKDRGKAKISITGEADIAVANKKSIDTTLIAKTEDQQKTERIPTLDKKDTAIKAPTENQKKRKKQSWQFSLLAAAGISNTATAFLKEDKANGQLFSVSSPPTGQPGIAPQNTSAGIAFKLAFYAERKLSPKWKFITGLGYSYFSSHINVGSRIDTATSFNSGNYAVAYYGNSRQHNYTNTFHFIELPLLFQYSLSKKNPVYLEGGPALNYLLKSDALIYQSSLQNYYTSKNIFATTVLSFNAGAGIDLFQRKRVPVSVGYRFNFSLGSATKSSVEKKYISGSLLYLKISLKK